jgi:nucleotide-binding universal stress UspA family protein
MTAKLVVGLDGHASGELALAHARHLAELIGDCELVVVYIIEWSPFSFQTAEENAKRHKRREEEIQTALTRVVNPAVEKLSSSGLTVRGKVRHGDVAQALIAIAKEENAEQIIVARTSEGGFAKRLFGSSTSNLVMSSPVPVTVVSREGTKI